VKARGEAEVHTERKIELLKADVKAEKLIADNAELEDRMYR
jgi:hypothetical protein